MDEFRAGAGRVQQPTGPGSDRDGRVREDDARGCLLDTRECVDVTIYQYRCDEDGLIELAYPMGEAPASTACTACGAAASRVFCSPQLTFSSPETRQVQKATEHAWRTAEKPDVVTSIPPATRRKRRSTVPLTPTLRRLPRP